MQWKLLICIPTKYIKNNLGLLDLQFQILQKHPFTVRSVRSNKFHVNFKKRRTHLNHVCSVVLPSHQELRWWIKSKRLFNYTWISKLNWKYENSKHDKKHILLQKLQLKNVRVFQKICPGTIHLSIHLGTQGLYHLFLISYQLL